MQRLFCFVLFDVRSQHTRNQHQLRTSCGRQVVGEQDKGKAGWRWPQLEFDIDNLFAVGSPVAMFLAVRGDVLSESWPRGPRPNLDFTLPGGAR